MKKILALTLGLMLGAVSTCYAAFSYEGKAVKLDAPEGYFVFRYPVLAGETQEEKNVAANINARLGTLAQREAQDIKTTWNSKELDSAYKSKDVDYSVTYMTDKIMSLNFTCTFVRGEGEALYFKDGWTFDLRNGKPLTWRDLVSPEDKPKMAKEVILRKLHQGSDAGDYTIYWSLDKLDSSCTNFYVGSAGFVHLQFNPYEVGPAKSGVIDVDTDCHIKAL